MVKKKLILEDDLKVQNKQVLEWIDLTEKTFDFVCYAHIWFEKGDDKAKRAILACLGSNLTLKSKKVFVNYHSFIKTLIKSRQAVEEELERARTSKISSNKRQNPALREVSSLGLPLLDAFRTLNWNKIQQDLEFSGILSLFHTPALQNI